VSNKDEKINNFDVSKEIDGAANLAEEVTVSKNN
jgi:hypothetical protein